MSNDDRTGDLFAGPPARKQRITHKRAAEKRDRGMKQATNHAEEVSQGWKENARALFMQYAREAQRPFLTEDVIEWAEGRIEEPPTRKAWGSIARSLSIAGLIESCGTARARTSNHSHKVLWRLKR